MVKLIFCLLLLSSGFWVSGQRLTPREYIEKYKDLAIREMKRSGVPASITLAQGLLESDCGNSDLVKQSNNHFGIKCKSNWTGPTVKHDDDRPEECFRAYEHPEESFRDHSDFLKNSPRYSFLFELDPLDYVDWSKGLKKAGYATNPKYANILIDNIEKYNLNQYTLEGIMQGVSDTEYQVASTKSMQPENVIPVPEITSENSFIILKVNGLKAVRVSAGTSLLAVATKFNKRLGKLMEWNELENSGILPHNQLIFLEKKRNEGESDEYVSDKDQSLYEIAQNLGITVSALRQYNSFNRDEEIKTGTTIYLRPGLNAKHNDTVQFKSKEKDSVFHVVEPKEGLFSISKKYGVTVAQLKEWNELASDNLQIGQKLIVSQ